MYRKEVYLCLNDVFDLMLDNKLREDMDDTLLEKLLSVIKTKMAQNYSAIDDFLEETKALLLTEKVVESLRGQTANFSASIQKFALELTGVLFGDENVFTLYQNSSVLRDLSLAFKPNATFSPTVQSAALVCFKNIAEHVLGVMWLKENGVIDSMFSCFSCSSYHVRSKAVSFYCTVLNMWEYPYVQSSLTERQQFTVYITVGGVLAHLMEGTRLCNDSDSTDCCLRTLIASFHIPRLQDIVKDNSILTQQITYYFWGLRKGDDVNRKVVELLLAMFSSLLAYRLVEGYGKDEYSRLQDFQTAIFYTDCLPEIRIFPGHFNHQKYVWRGLSEEFLKEMLEELTSRSMFAPAAYLVGSILSVSQQYQPLSREHIQFLILPLQVLSGSPLPDCKGDFFGLSSAAASASLSKAMEVKSDCITIIIASLLALSKAVELMDSGALEAALTSISIVTTGPTCCQHHPMSYVCLENRKICFALSELLSAFLHEQVYPVMKLKNQLDLLNYLLCFIEKPFDRNVSTEAMKMLGNLIILNDKHSISFPDEVKEKVVFLLCKRVMDKSETIAISALSLAGLLMSNDERRSWEEIILKHSLHQIMWEMAAHGVHDETLKAASLNAALQALLVPRYWQDIRSAKRVDEADVMQVFLRYFRGVDFYVQQESLRCAFEWLKHTEDRLTEPCRQAALLVFWEAVRSLDLDQKLAALEAWEWLLSSSSSFRSAGTPDELLETACVSGFASSLVLALEDYDEAVHYKASKMLIRFRETLLQMGYSAPNFKNCPSATDTDLHSAACSQKEFCPAPISKEERDAGIENVMNLTTAQQIAKLAVSPEEGLTEERGSPLHVTSLSYPLDSFLNVVWQDRHDSTVSKADVSSDLFSDYTMSVLDDIIASNIKETQRPVEDILDCY
ncbi:uncharacterized protein CEXT_326301 [Caerostris extrusa]|uniref:BRCA1-associated ATM activator 1 n=1 Tax=Caerostris extrusa TaxID=172846 RepID=A0AAV4URB0_CAEEX|nr:uncharacterized protein CEXT_326301 [Caerostris extrusa]